MTQTLPGVIDKSEAGTITCLGLTFPSHQARREHFTDRLREFLNDPEYRARHDLPRADIEDILRLSDPPYYTACPNPFLPEFVEAWAAASPHRDEPPQANPLAIDVSEGKGDPLYKAHSYHTKVPFKAILPAILHYTKPGDIVLDGFCGSGMVGVAAQLCGTTDPHLRAWAEALLTGAGYDAPQWGARHAILNDLSPAATFIASGYNLPFDVPAFEREAQRLLHDFDAELGWMYETKHTDGSPGRINYTVWSQVFACPHCHGDITFTHAAMNPETGKIVEPFPCPHCHATVAKRGSQKEGIAALTPLYETVPDPANTSQTMQRLRREPVLINYEAKGGRFEKHPDANDIAILDRIEQMPLPESVPTNALPLDQMYHGTRLGPKGITHLHHFYLPRQAQALGWLWDRASAQADTALRRMLLWFVEQQLWGMSVMNRYQPIQYGRTGGSQVGRQLNGVYYVPAVFAECSVPYAMDGKRERLGKAFESPYAARGAIAIQTGTAAVLDIQSDCIDYIFTDPPFGENIYYADLNYLVESWHRVLTNSVGEAIVDQAKRKELPDYQRLMMDCLVEYNRVLKPGHWMTLVFSNSLNAVWMAIQDALAAAGFLVADVRALDKEAMSFRQATSDAIKKDLIVSAYKPSAGFAARLQDRTGTPESAWVFVEEHLKQVPIFSAMEEEGETRGEVLTERQPHVLYDRMVAWHVLHTYPVPISLGDFLRELRERYAELDGMMFLPDQVAEYERSRERVPRMQQALLFNDG